MEPESMSEEAVASKLQSADLPSRRSFLQKSAAAGAGALALAVGSSNTVLASEGDDEDVSEIDVLNFALTLEHLEYEFYEQGLERFDEQDFRGAKTLRPFSGQTKKRVRSRIEEVRDHERTHVEQLTAVIEKLGGDPVEEACYEFGVNHVHDFLTVAQVLENTGVSAYNGSISDLDTDELATAGATIATVEARHASYLNFLNHDTPFPNAFDPASPRKEVLEKASGFIVECK